MKKKIVIFTCSTVLLVSCAELEKVVSEAVKVNTTQNAPLTEAEVINGLKEALEVGTKNVVKQVSVENGFYENPRIKIEFPPEAQKVKEKVLALGMEAQVQKFEYTLNRAAEEAAKEATPIFIEAITSMTIEDGFAILKGEENAATKYLKEKTSQQLYDKFYPVVQQAINKVELTKYWQPLIDTYNKIPLVEKVNPDLTDYVTQRSIEGLFIMIADEEKKIRQDPAARVTDLLKRVFGNIAHN